MEVLAVQLQIVIFTDLVIAWAVTYKYTARSYIFQGLRALKRFPLPRD